MKKLIIIFLMVVSAGLASSAAYAIDILPSCVTTDAVTGKCIGVCATAPDSPACAQANAQATSGSNPIAGPNGVLQKAANLIAELTGVVGVIMLIVGGFIYTTAGGAPSIGGQRSGDNPGKAKKARTMIFTSLTGIVVVALAWSIVTFVVQRFIK